MLKYLMVGMVAAVVVAAAACSNDTAGTTVLHEAEQDGAGGCPTDPTILTGTAAEGSACKAATDCAPICCTCTTGTGQWLAAECLDDECKAATACADTAETGFCK